MIRGYTDIMILYLLLEAPSYGYEISKSIKILALDDYAMKETTLYSAIKRLESKDYVDTFYKIAENGKKRTYYKITDLGTSYYKEKCQEWKKIKLIVDRFIE